MMHNDRRFAHRISALFWLLPAVAWGQTNNWTGPGEGSWNIPANWSLGVVPTSAHTVSIVNNTVILNSAPAAAALILNIQGSELHVFNGASLAAVTSNVGFVGNGLLRVAGQGTQATFQPVGSIASLNLGGPGFAGTLMVEDGALVQTSAALDQAVSLGISGVGTGHIQLTGTEASRGVLAAGRVVKSGAGTVTFNGGVLRGLTADADILLNFAPGDVVLNAGGAFIDTNGLILSISAPMSGTGGLTKQGTGTLLLTGANTYTGGTVISEGVLQIGTGGASGSVTGNIVNHSVIPSNPSLVFNHSGDLTYAGQISGPGTFAKRGTGVLTLTGTSIHTGITLVQGGILRVSGSGSINQPGSTLSSEHPGTIEIISGGEVTTLQSLISSKVLVSGAGSTLTSTKELWLASGTFGTALTIENAGTVSVGTEMRIASHPDGDGILNIGAFDLGNPTTAGTLQAANVIFGVFSTVGIGVINFNQTDATTFSASVSGPGSVIQRGIGTTRLTGTLTHTGGTTVSGGTLQIGDGGTSGSIAGNISLTNGANLAFNRADAHGYAGQLSGIGTLTKLGTGTLTLTGANTHTAGTRVKAGVLRVSGTGSIVHPFGGLDVVVGDTADDAGALEVLAGGTVTNSNGVLGNTVGSTGTVTVSGTDAVWTSFDSLRIGSAGSNSTLTIQNGGVVSSGPSFIGYEATASNNSAVVSGDALWTNSAELTVGYAGSFNHLSIQSGGSVESLEGYIGRMSTAGNNSAVVSGENAVWTSPQGIYLGYAGNGNTLTIQNGGSVSSGSGYVGALDSADSNSALVRDGGQWTNTAELVVGASGSDNMLIIEGGAVSDTEGYIGLNSDAGFNHVVVSGDTSTWTHSDELAVGFSGSSNFLTIENGGRVSDDSAVIGYDGVANSNSVRVTGADSTWEHAQVLVVGQYGDDNSLAIEDGGRVTNAGGVDYIGYEFTASNNRVRVSGQGAAWANAGTGSASKPGMILVGYNGPDNQLTIENGGSVSCHEARIGQSNTADNNSVLVSGQGSTWTGKILRVGYDGSDNSLTIEDGAHVYAPWTFTISSTGDNNRVLVTGEGSKLQIGEDDESVGQLIVGGSGVGNSLIIENGAEVSATSLNGFLINTGSNARDNSVIVRGQGSSFTHNGLSLARVGRKATFTIEDGARALNRNTYSNIANESTMTISGAGSIYETTNFSLGITPQPLGGCKLIIRDGGMLASYPITTFAPPYGSIGYDNRGGGQHSINNSVLVTGADSAWTNAGPVYINRDNTLTIEDGGRVTVGNGTGTLTFISEGSAGGTLNIGAFDLATPTTAGVLEAGSVLFGNGMDVINFNQTDATTFRAAISGSGRLVQHGSGVTTLTGASTHTGGTLVSGGTLQIGNGGISGSVSGDIVNHAWLIFNRADTVVHAGQISGSGTLVKRGAGTLTLTAANTYSGMTIVEAGTLRLDQAALHDQANVVLRPSGRLELDHTDTDVIRGLCLGGEVAAPGAWGSLESTALHKTPFITGTGILHVSTSTDVECGCVLDSDTDGVSDCDDFCPGTIPGAFVDPQGCSNIPADLDGDGDVDTDDLVLMGACRSRPFVSHDGSPLCQAADIDGDDDVDHEDFGAYQRCYSGHNVPGDPGCAP